GQEVPKVLDFGIAKIAGSAALQQKVTLEGWIVGTPAYMAPERFGSAAVTGQSDVYSAGVMLFQMLTRRLPFETGGDPLEVAARPAKEAPPAMRGLRPEVPAAVDETVLAALRKRPEDRPSAREMADRLAALAATPTAMRV